MEISWGGLVVLVLVLACVGGLTFAQIRVQMRVQPKANWPIVEATIQPGGMRRISMRKRTYAACFLGYAFEAEGERRAGVFALYGDSEGIVEMVGKNLPGNAVKVLYDPDDPDVSVLLYSADSRFGGLRVTQDPALLSQAPECDLKDVMGK